MASTIDMIQRRAARFCNNNYYKITEMWCIISRGSEAVTYAVNHNGGMAESRARNWVDSSDTCQWQGYSAAGYSKFNINKIMVALMEIAMVAYMSLGLCGFAHDGDLSFRVSPVLISEMIGQLKLEAPNIWRTNRRFTLDNAITNHSIRSTPANTVTDIHSSLEQ